jgi:hypothetical protein
MSHCIRQAGSKLLARTLVHDGALNSGPAARIGRIKTAIATKGIPPPAGRRLQSSSSSPPSPNPPGGKPETAEVPVVRNLVLAGALLAFGGGVFTYSMNAVGKSGGEGEDPLAQLRAEAEEMRATDAALLHRTERLTPEEIERLESGLSDDVAAPLAGGGTDAVEEEGALPSGDKPKKAWWRFGF